MKKLLFLLMMMYGVLSSCTDQDDKLTGISIRIKNDSTLVFDEVEVNAQDSVYELVGPGEYSEYLVYDSAYKTAAIKIVSGENTYSLQPTDFVGETELPYGFYTYELDITEDGQVILNFKVD